MKLKRFLLFAGYNYYPSGGWKDFKDSFDTLEEAEDAAYMHRISNGDDWTQIVDTNDGDIVR